MGEKTYAAQDLIAKYEAYVREFGRPKSVLYPSCGFDASPSEVFGNVTYVDIEHGNEGCIQALKERGLNAIKSDIRRYVPGEKHDLIILLNSAIPSLWATKFLRRGGHVLANNYLRNAEQLHMHPTQFALEGTITYDNEKASLTRDNHGFFRKVENWEEFEEFRPEYAQFHRVWVEASLKNGEITLTKGETFDNAWKRWLEKNKEPKPYKKSISGNDFYIFRKKRDEKFLLNLVDRFATKKLR